MVKSFKNGDEVIASCIFCGVDFEENQPIGKKIECPSEEDGGCGNHYRISMYSETSIKSGSE